jgi:hypothetical protein
MIGIQISTRSSASNGNSNPAGITPTTVTGSPSSTTDRPTIEGSRENCRLHRPSEMIAVRGAPRASSPGPKTRPCIGATPSIGNRSAVTTASGLDWASPAPVNVTAAVAYAAIRSIVVACVRHSRKSR